MLLGDVDAARDAMQEVFLRALNVSGGLDPSPLGWLYRTTTNLCLNRLRDGKRRNELLSLEVSDDVATDDIESRVLVLRVLERVPQELQDIAIYYFVDGLSHDEIAKVAGVSRRTVGNRISDFQNLVSGIVKQGSAS
jgi:RNA polymerase sigma-70 factor (ECF subfamily)